MPDNPNRSDIARRTEKAEKLLQKGKAPDALAEYLQILEINPHNDSVRQIAADLCISVNKTPQAVQLLGELFERQVAAGDATRASLTYKKLTRYAAPTWEQKVRFGRVLETSNKKLAIATYESALEDLERQEKKEEELLVLRRIVSLDPSQANILRVAEHSATLGQHALASQYFLQLAAQGGTSGGSGGKYFERAHSENPKDPKVVLAYGKSLLTRGDAAAAVSIFEPFVKSGGEPGELLEPYSQAMVAAGRYLDAEPMIWQMFEQNPARISQVVGLIGKMIDSGLDTESVTLARKLEVFQRRRGERRSFISTMQDLLASRRPSTQMLEFLAELFNASNRESDYADALIKLFDLHIAKQDFQKAGECLDRAAEVDPYEPGHQKRLDALQGKIDAQRFNMIASRISSLEKKVEQTVKAEEPVLGAATLQDLMLQAEILVQYGMRVKAIERLHRIRELFPGEEERNLDLQRLYISTGIERQHVNPPSAPVPPPVSASPALPALPPSAPTTDSSDVSSLARVAEIARKLYNQGNAQGVLKTAAREIGEAWHSTRCIAALRKPGLTVTSVQEHQGEALLPVGPGAMVSLVTTLQDLAVARGSVAIREAAHAPELIEVHKAVEQLQIESLLALPLTDGTEQIGVLVLAQNASRVWQPSEVLVIRSLCDHIVIALNNAGLRRLVKNLSVTEEKSGLLKRASYVDFLQAETQRGLQQGTAVTVLLMHFGHRTLAKEISEAEVNRMMDQVGQLLSSNIRTSDLAFRYEETTAALVLGDTAEKDAQHAVEKLRRLLAEVRLPGQTQPVELCAAIAQTVMRQDFDPVDIVTEVINRADQALELAIMQGPGTVVCQPPQFASAAVA
ncbi:MAG: diguanylate cyclase [Terriglobales bacterium]|jgi:tetratricopeptide (TPR) repeat protein/GGDEF domain-containing protein